MLAKKRIGDEFTFSSMNKRACCSAGETTEGDLYGDSKQGVWSLLGEQAVSELCKSVVSIALSDGHMELYACSGIAIQCNVHVSTFLTSASLVRAMDNLTKSHDHVEIKVRHEERVVTGYLVDYDLDYELAVVKITSSLDVHNIPLNPATRFLPNCGVVAVRCDISGKLIATSGKLTHYSCVYEDIECLMFSTCKLSEVWEGGPLVDFLGYFVGMNLFSSTARSFFLPMSIIMERLDHFKTSQQRNFFLARVKDFKMERVGERLTDDISHPEGEYTVVPSTKLHTEVKDARDKDPFEHFEALGYPKPSKRGMILVNSFEAPFGDLYPSGVWKRLDKRSISNIIFESVVSLASFNGSTRLFACTGFFIDWDDGCHDNSVSTILTSASLVRNPDGENELADSLMIAVLLPEGGDPIEGTLIHYNLHYNVALVSVKNFRAKYPANLKHEWVNESKLVAVGRCFQSGDLMASRGKLVGWSGPLQCDMLLYSTCKITKAGIGGPVVDYKGRFVGMNFFDPKMGTPFLFCDDIVAILECFKKKRTRAKVDNFRIDGDDSIGLNWWPVPRPYWRCPEDRVHDYMDEHEREILDSGCKYKYQGGRILLCK
ncbi:unnamed protein product [Urochloa humidicola]